MRLGLTVRPSRANTGTDQPSHAAGWVAFLVGVLALLLPPPPYLISVDVVVSGGTGGDAGAW